MKPRNAVADAMSKQPTIESMALSTVVINSFDSGAYSFDDQSDPTIKRPFLRWFGDAGSERSRGYLAFNLSGFQVKDNEAIVSAAVELFVETGLGYQSPNLQEPFHLCRVPPSQVDAILTGGRQEGLFRALGDGSVLGTNFVRKADQGQAITAALNDEGLFLIDSTWQLRDKRLILGSRIEPGGNADRRLFGSNSATPPLDWFRLAITLRTL